MHLCLSTSSQPNRQRLLNIELTSISARIRLAREQAQIDAVQIRKALQARGIELSKTGWHRLETIEPKNPSLKLIEAIAEITKVSPAWLLFGKGPAVPSNEVNAAIRNRVLETIELMSRSLDMTAKQQQSFDGWMSSMREERSRNNANRKSNNRKRPA